MLLYKYLFRSLQIFTSLASEYEFGSVIKAPRSCCKRAVVVLRDERAREKTLP